MRRSNTSSTWLSNRIVVAKEGENSYSRCTSRRGRNSALKIIRIGFEKPVAVYSICGVNPRWPQSQVGPRRVFDLRAKSTVQQPTATEEILKMLQAGVSKDVLKAYIE